MLPDCVSPLRLFNHTNSHDLLNARIIKDNDRRRLTNLDSRFAVLVDLRGFDEGFGFIRLAAAQQNFLKGQHYYPLFLRASHSSYCIRMLPSIQWDTHSTNIHNCPPIDFWMLFITFIELKHNNPRLGLICGIFHVYHKWCCLWKWHVWSGMKIQCDACHVCSQSPRGAHCFTYSPSGTSWVLFKQCWWARNMAQSAPWWCSLWQAEVWSIDFHVCWIVKIACAHFSSGLCTVWTCTRHVCIYCAPFYNVYRCLNFANIMKV